MTSHPDSAPPPPEPPGPDGESGAPAPSYAPLEDALQRAVSTTPWWRRWLPTTRRGSAPLAAALGAVLVLSLLGIAAPWNRGPTSAQGGGGAADPDRPVLLSPSPAPVTPPSPQNRSEAGESSPDAPGADPGTCPAPLSVVAALEIADLVRELAGPLADGSCPEVAVTGRGPAATLRTLAAGDDPPDVWIPASSLWLRLAASGGGAADLPSSGPSIARSPVVIALPEPVADTVDGIPSWVLVYNEVTDGGIPRMSMPDRDSTAGALALVSLLAGLEEYTDHDDTRTFWATMHFRGKLASTDADVPALLDRLAGTPPARAGAEVGVFPATEQQLIAYHRRDAATPVVPMATYDASIDADYPLAVSEALDGRRAELADALRARLRAPAAVPRLVDAGFRPPGDPGMVETGGFPAGYRNPFPADVGYPDPVALPDAAGWRTLVDGWTWEA